MSNWQSSTTRMRPLHFSILCGLYGPLLAYGQNVFNVYANASDIEPLPTNPACAEALSADIQCSARIVDTLPSSSLALSNLTRADLLDLCTSTCFDSLNTVAATVDKECVGWPFIVGSASYVASLPFRNLAYRWNIACTMDNSTSPSRFCLEEQGPASETDQDILSLPATQLCSQCNLQNLELQMTSPFGWDGSFVDDWHAIQTTCNFQTNNNIPASLIFTGIANGSMANATASPTRSPASTAKCLFGSYTIQNGDTCTSIAASKSLSLDQLISINGLDLNCTKLPPSGSQICLSGACSLYTVQAADTCVSISVQKGVTWAQLLKWNSQLNTYCDNLDAQIGKSICVGPPGGSYSPASTLAPVIGSPTAIATPTAPISPGADRAHCGQWYVAVPGDTCPQILQVFQMTNDTFYELNPLVNSDCSNLIAGFSYCVELFGNITSTTDVFSLPTTAPPGATLIQYISGDFPAGTGFLTSAANVTNMQPILPPTTVFTPSATPTPTIASGTISNETCLQYYEIQAGDTCFAIEVEYGITDDEFRLWNPEIDSNCGNIEVGLSYCVFGPTIFTTLSGTFTFTPTSAMSSSATSASASAVPTNIASGTITSGCLQYYTIQPNDNCALIDTQFSISFSQFVAWNPEVNSDCSNIILDEAYCVNGPTVSSSSAPASSPTAPGTITTGCTQYYTVVSGDFCGKIESQFGISFAQFVAWNPEVDAACDNIQAGLQYCVSGPSSTTSAAPTSSPTAPGTITTGCTDYYTVVSGDFCSKIEDQFSISLAQFLKWNAGVNAQCSNLQIGFEYCVSGP
ncbi:hypothetical protein C8R46DRAFT_1189193 [Mycena filopes]|nr:hypothetical protein C8R46DRAFT_1189193 [Mycena filopes]